MGIGEVGERLRRSTVHIRATHRRRESAGSGVISDANGTVITNAHVLGSGAQSIELWDGRCLPAEITLRDDTRDLAALRVPAAALPAASFRERAVRPGELVVAVGNPLGFTGALTTGVVHAAGSFPSLGRRVWVQAAIRLAPGNSGGPLADTAGEVVGINTMIVSGGIALAIPSAAVNSFLKHGAAPRLGVAVQPVRLNRPDRLGLLILSVDRDSAAERASLLIGDVLTGTAQAPFTAAADLSDAIGTCIDATADRLTLRFLRGERKREREVVIALAARAAREAA